MAMIGNRRKTLVAAYTLVAPFVVVFALFFVYPALKVVITSFTDAPLIGRGSWVGFDNYLRLFADKLFFTSVKNNIYFVALTIIPNAAIALVFALMVNRLKGRFQALMLIFFFLPYILPVSVVTEIWLWMLDFQYGVLQPVIAFFVGKPVAVFKNPNWVMPMVAVTTIWWTNGFNVLLFLAGLRNIPPELYEAAALDGANPRQQFLRVTWPLLWPITSLVLTLQLIIQLKLFDQIYLMTQGGPFNSSYVLLLMMYREAFQLNHGGYAASIAVVLVVVIATISVLQFQLLRARGQR